MIRLAAALAALLVAAPAIAQTAVSLAADRVARQVGDPLTVVILESASSSRTADTDVRRRTALAAEGALDARTERASGSLEAGFAGAGRSSHSERLAGTVTVSVVEVLPNGDLRVRGEETLVVNGERTVIQAAGRVRPADISADNTVLSSRLAEADIRFAGDGFARRGARPGLVPRLLGRLGLF